MFVTPPRSPAGRRRTGFSLIELLVVIVLMSIVMGAIYRVITRQQRFYVGVNEVMAQRSQLRQATAVLPLELRNVSSAGGDFIAVSDSVLEMRVQVGTSLVCAIDPSRGYIDLPPMNLAAGHTLTAFTTMPRPGDEAFIYDDGTITGNVDDTWVRRELTSVASPTTCIGAPYSQAADDAKARWRLNFGPTLPATVVIGAPVRITRIVRYSLYKATDGQSYLGYEDYNGSAWSGMEVVAGPYDATDGVQFLFYAEDGTQIASVPSANPIARVDLAVRGTTARAINVEGITRGHYADSLAVSVAIRNRK